MLSSMNVTVIPFLIEALVSVKNQTEWIFGPELVFELNKTITIYMNVYMIETRTATVECRPKVSQNVENVLYCHAHKITFSKITQKVYEYRRTNGTDAARSFTPQESNIEIGRIRDHFIEMEFSKEGSVKSFRVEEYSEEDDKQPYCDIILDITEQFDNEIDLSIEAGSSMKNYENKTRGSYIISSFTRSDVNTVRADKCNTTVMITYTPANRFHKAEEFFQKSNRKSDFYLRLLPISYPNPADKTFSIKRYRTACTYYENTSGYIQFLNEEKWDIDNIVQYYNEMEIHDTKPKFISRTHLEGTILFPNSEQTYEFTEDVHLALLRITPARRKLDLSAKYVYHFC